MLFALTKGNLYYINEVMSCYRTFSEGSWSLKLKKEHKGACHFQNMNSGFEAFNDYTNKKYDVYLSEICERNKFIIALALWDGKTCSSKKFRKYYQCLGKKQKLKVIIFYFFPI